MNLAELVTKHPEVRIEENPVSDTVSWWRVTNGDVEVLVDVNLTCQILIQKIPITTVHAIEGVEAAIEIAKDRDKIIANFRKSITDLRERYRTKLKHADVAADIVVALEYDAELSTVGKLPDLIKAVISALRP
jgi:hypothetical protein